MHDKTYENIITYFVKQLKDNQWNKEIEERLTKSKKVNDTISFIKNLNLKKDLKNKSITITYQNKNVTLKNVELERDFKISDVIGFENAWELVHKKITEKGEFVNFFPKWSQKGSNEDYILNKNSIEEIKKISNQDKVKGKGVLMVLGRIEQLAKKSDDDENFIRKTLDDIYDKLYLLFQIPDSCSTQNGHHIEALTNNWLWDLIDLINLIKSETIEDLMRSFNKEENKELIKKINAKYSYSKVPENEKKYVSKLYQWNWLIELIGYANIDYLQPVNGRTKMYLFNENWKNPDDVFDLYNTFEYSNSFQNEYFIDIEISKDRLNAASHYFWYWMDTKANIEGFKEIFGKNISIEKIRKEIIFYGPPGTGKTRYADMLADVLTGFDKEKVRTVQFHPNYGYEHFIEGLRPIINDGNVSYGVQDGEFLSFLRNAEDEWSKYENNVNENKIFKPFVFIIDEINRADVSRVFGELLYLLEYRDKDKSKLLPESNIIIDEEIKGKRGMKMCNLKNPSYWVPPNVFIIATMNNLDKSLVQLDFAFRRRFFWFLLNYDENALRNILDNSNYSRNNNENGEFDNDGQSDELDHIEDYIKLCTKLNNLLKKNLSEEHMIGHAYFMRIKDFLDGAENVYDYLQSKDVNILVKPMEKVWSYYLEPLIKEYLGKRAYEDLDIYKKEFLGK